MKQLFLYRLLKHSTPAFIFVVLFISFYAITFFKKMDMVLFPFNNMYTVDFTKNKTATTYAMKINGNMVKITHQPYWKKDFLETSLNVYSKYIRYHRKVFLDDYIPYKFHNEQTRKILLHGLTPDKTTAMSWPAWYVHFAGYNLPANSTIELTQYNFLLDKEQAVLKDSISIFKEIFP
jgi:hypothetical protein